MMRGKISLCRDNGGKEQSVCKQDGCLQAGTKKGRRCTVCTGCGLCPGVTPGNTGGSGISVLAEEALKGEGMPFRHGRRLAVADIGTTTVAMLLCGRDGKTADRYLTVNPQVSYGADVISRIRAAEKKEAADHMREQIRQALQRGLERFKARLREGETLYLVLAANTTMTYLLMGWDTAELGRAPFRASRLSGAETEIAGVKCFVFPGLSAFVGGDIAAGICACGMCEKEELTLLLDLGTNGEMVLGNRKRRIACATAAGPAFEGGVNRGVWGSDMVSLLARLRQEGLLDSAGLLAEPYFEHGIRIGNVTVTQEAVRSVQLAKGAIAAGIEILMERFGVGPEAVERVILAGGFGYYLRPEAAAAIGLLPESLAPKAQAGGNTALAGALLAGRRILADGGCAPFAGELAETVLRTEVLNLAEEKDFAARYVRLMDLGVAGHSQPG